MHFTMMINWPIVEIDEKKIDFLKIKFHSNENIELDCTQIELNWIELN
jgi:hypothetical protein